MKFSSFQSWILIVIVLFFVSCTPNQYKSGQSSKNKPNREKQVKQRVQTNNKNKCDSEGPGVSTFSLFFITTVLTYFTDSTDDSCSTSMNEKQQFVFINIERIIEESAEGKGPHLDALAKLYSCKESSYGQFSTLMNRNFNSLFIAEAEKESVDQILNNVSMYIRDDKALQHECQI